MPTPRPGTPRYRQVAEELRRRIEAGVIPPGSLLPAESALVREFGISRGTAREAIATLRTEGLVVTEHGRGTHVRQMLPVRRLDLERYRGYDAHLGASGHQITMTSREVAATTALAALFQVRPGTVLLERRIKCSAHGVPQEISTSYYPLEMVAGTPLAYSHQRSSSYDVRDELRQIGISVTRIREIVRARMPTPSEAEVLRLTGSTPVLSITRQTYATSRIVEVAQDIVLPSDRTNLDYEIDIADYKEGE